MPAEAGGCVQVRSLTLDVKVWDEAVLGMMERIGNEVANEAWEAKLLNEDARSGSAWETNPNVNPSCNPKPNPRQIPPPPLH